jgi:hypothetical protein
VTIGQRFKLLKDFGNQAFDPIGARHGLEAGAVGTLVLEVAAAEKGAHNSEEDAYVLEFSDETRTVGSDGELKIGTHTRRCSFAVTDFDPDNPDHLFEPA